MTMIKKKWLQTTSYTIGVMILMLSMSCQSGWDKETQDLFLQGCLEDARERGMEESAAKSMCNCRLETAMRKFPNLSDALENIDVLIHDQDMKDCQ